METLATLSIGVIISALLFLVLIFVLLREFWCWYYKINLRVIKEGELIELVRKQNILLESMIVMLQKKAKENKIDLHI